MHEGNLGRDLIQNEPVEDLLTGWVRMIERREKYEPFAMFYIAGSDERVESVVNALSSDLSINKDHIIEFEVDPKQADVVANLFQLADQIQTLPGKRVMVAARGFERMIAQCAPDRYFRAGHDWDQDVVEGFDRTEWGKRYSAMGKHVVIITTIGFSAGAGVYDEAVKSAVGSQFRSGIIELENSS